MQFKFTKRVAKEVPSYGGKMIKTGDVVELTGRLAEKAKRNPDFELVEAEPAPAKSEAKAKTAAKGESAQSKAEPSPAKSE